MNGKLYGNASMGYAYSPDRSRDVDRFNPSTRSNYQFSTSNPYRQQTTDYRTDFYSGTSYGRGFRTYEEKMGY